MFEITDPDRTRARGQFLKPTFDFDGGVGWGGVVKGVDAHIDSSSICSWSIQPEDQNHTAGLKLNTHAHGQFSAFAFLLELHVLVVLAGLWDLLPVLHPEVLLVGAVGAGQIALQHNAWTAAFLKC